MSIQRLSDIVIAQIAAGEVIERPASVVKELVENALDAGATSVQVETVQGGRRRIRVSDNGSGIPNDQIELAFAQHATSKLRTAEDLQQLITLGFRGEALSSIVAVSRTHVMTRHRDEPTGTEMSLEGGALIRQQPIGAPAGTILSVEDLFFNTPARLKFLKKENTEKRYISTLITRFAMAYPGTQFVYMQDGREAFRSTGNTQLADVMVKVYGIKTFKQFVEVHGTEIHKDNQSEVQVSGYASLPDLTRGDRTHITLFVNGRWIQDSSLTYAVTQAYHTLLPPNRYPLSVLMINLPTDHVDVNVHPTKAEVRFRYPELIFTAVQRSVRNAIMASHSSGESPNFTRQVTPDASRSEGWNSHIQLDLKLGSEESNFSNVDSDARLQEHATTPEDLNRPRHPRTLPPLRIIGQVGAMYVVAEGPAGMYLIDQNAAHQRILYETLLDNYASGTADTRRLQSDQTVTLSARDSQILERLVTTLTKFGVDIENFGPVTFRIRGLPASIENRIQEPATIVHKLVATFVNGDPDDEIATVAQDISNLAAYRTGQILSEQQMQTLIRRLERCENPHSSPDGRATLIHLSGDQLAREFARS